MGTQLDPAPKPSPKVVAFGPFEYDELSGSVSKFGTPLRLNGKPLQILSLLVQKPGQIMGRDELQRHLWEGTTFVDFEQGLNSAVNKLRQTLGDSADQPRYIETLPGRGYRFIAPVQRAAAKPVLEMAAPAPLKLQPERRKRLQPGLLIAAGLALAGVAVGGYWLGLRARAPVAAPKAVRFTVLPPAGFALEGAASRQAFALSPDGTRLAFTAMDTSGEFSVFLREFNSLEPRLVPGSEGAHTVFWPPDGRSLYMTVNGKLWRTPLQGDARVLVADTPSFMLSGVVLGQNGSTPHQMLLDSFQATYRTSPSGPLERLKETYLWPQLLPGSEHALYVRWDARAGRLRAHVLRLGDYSSVADLMETDSRVQYSPSMITPGTGYLLFIRGGNLLAQPFDPRSLRLTGEPMPVARRVYSFTKTGAGDFSVSNSGALAWQSYSSRSQLVWVDRAGRQLATIGPANANLKSARLSPDGQRLATAIYDVERGQQDLWIFDVKTNAGRRLTADPAIRDAPVWSPDSKTLAYLYQADTHPPTIHVRSLQENNIGEAMPAADFQLPTDWSSDGRFVAFTSNESGRAELYVQAFRSGDTPGVFGERHLVSSAGAQAVRWRRDGKELFYLAFDGRVQAVPVRLASRPGFGAAKALFTISSEARAAIHSVIGFDVSADGNRFVIATSPEGPSLVVVQNWEALLPH
jgi:DNA-binding winged helix-turn-helix (wHTH) protein